jgi:hypothetical protein
MMPPMLVFGKIAMIAAAALAATTVPATKPVPATQSAETLAAGAIRFKIPDGLVLLGKRVDDLSASCAPADDSALLTLVVAPQQSAVEDQLARKLGPLIVKTIEEQAAKGEIESLSPPKIERDKRFLLRVHDRFKAKGKIGDRVQLYRGMGKYLVSVTATDFSENSDRGKLTHERGELFALSVALNRPDRERQPPAPATRPTTFSQARVRLTAPPGWRGETNDQPAGIIATWRDPDDRTNLIAASVRQIPKEARSDPTLRDAIVDEIVAAERQSFVIDGAEPAGQTQTINDKRFLRKTRTDYESRGVKFRVTARQIRVGSTILSVTVVALQDRADEIDALGDNVAVEARAVGPN